MSIIQNSRVNRKLIQLALVSSPVLALYVIMPWYLYLSSTNAEIHDFAFGRLTRLAMTTGWVSLVFLIFWYVNLNIYGSTRIKNRYLKHAISFGFILAVTYIATYRFQLDPGRFGVFREIRFINAISTNAFMVIAIRFWESEGQRSQLALKNAQLEISSLIAREEQLKSQIHPHFLFNCLSNLNALIATDQKRAMQYADHLAFFLRQSLENGKHRTITIAEELTLLNHYLELQKVRFGDVISCDIRIPEELTKKRCLPVFTLQILVENAIKHTAFNALTPLSISIVYEDDFLVVENNKSPVRDVEEGTGTGLLNLSNRYKLLGEGEVMIEDSENKFTVRINTLECA